jgi:glutathione S-transferase
VLEVTLYGAGTSRSARCRWALAEAEIEFELIERPGLARSDELRKFHPLAKLPVAVFDGQVLFESAAICTYIADHANTPGLITAPGTWGRAMHDQWVSYCLTEMEAWLWNTAVNSFALPEAERITAGFEQNIEMFKRSLVGMEAHLAVHDFFVEDRFTVTDIICGWTLNWGRRQGHLDDAPAAQRYVQRLLQRPLCTFASD